MYAVKDARLSVTKALSNGAGSVTTDAIDLELSANGDLHARCELVIDAPALTTTLLPDTETMKYDVIHSDNSDLSSPTTIAASVVVQTGAGGAGAAAIAGTRFSLPSTVKRYVGVKVTKTGTGNASTVSVTVALAF